nr:transposase, MuDR, MULE transposase domain protein [Tanacetum cinerariifolium]
MVFRIIDDELFDRLHDDNAVILCCLGILQLVLLGMDGKRKIPDWMLRLENDRGNMPATRLTPNEIEARSDWWISSREYFDGEDMNAEQLRQANKGPIIVSQHYVISDLSEFPSMQVHPNSSSFLNIGTPTNWQTPMSIKLAKPDSDAVGHSLFWQLTFPSHPGTYNWKSQIPSHMGNLNLEPPIKRHHNAVGLFNQNILNQRKREHRPSFYKRILYMEQPPTDVLPKQCGNKNKNNVMKANLSPLNLGNGFDDKNKGGTDVILLGGQFTGNYLVYENVDSEKNVIKGYSVPVTFWQQLVPHLCMPDIDSCTPVGWLSGEHMNAWMELLIRFRGNNSPWTVAYTNTISVYPKNQLVLIETDQHTIGTLDGSMRPYQAWSVVNWPDAYKKLCDAHSQRWSRAHYALIRYNYTTSNSVVSVIACSVIYRKEPVLKLAKTYRAMVQQWYYQRRQLAANMTYEITDWASHKVARKSMKSAKWVVKGVNEYQYQVSDGQYIREVNLQTGTCECRKWQLSGLPGGRNIQKAIPPRMDNPQPSRPRYIKRIQSCWELLKRLRFVPTDRVIQFLLMALCVSAGSSSCDSVGHIEAVPAGHVLVFADRYRIC